MQAILLAQHIIEVGVALFSGARVIELGAGTGLVGMVASTLGKITDCVDNSHQLCIDR